MKTWNGFEKGGNIPMTYHQELQHRLFQQQEEQVHHMEYQQEFQYYEDVANGRLDRIHLQLLQPKDIVVYNDGEYGMLSKDPLRNLRYHFVYYRTDLIKEQRILYEFYGKMGIMTDRER